MQIIGEIAHPRCRITLFHWNNRYLVKLEAGRLEQTFKIDEFDIQGEAELRALITEPFIEESMERFDSMHSSLIKALHDHPPGAGT